jgi:hypothetical protein
MGRRRVRRIEEDNDDAFTEDGVLKDHRSTRVSLMDAESSRRKQLHNIVDTDDALFVSHFVAQNFRDGRHPAADQLTEFDRACAEYDNNMNSRYMGDAEGPEGSPCTVRNEHYPNSLGSPGIIKDGICVPIPGHNRDAAQTDDRAAAYAAYDEQQANAWKGGDR